MWVSKAILTGGCYIQLSTAVLASRRLCHWLCGKQVETARVGYQPVLPAKDRLGCGRSKGASCCCNQTVFSKSLDQRRRQDRTAIRGWHTAFTEADAPDFLQVPREKLILLIGSRLIRAEQQAVPGPKGFCAGLSIQRRSLFVLRSLQEKQSRLGSRLGYLSSVRLLSSLQNCWRTALLSLVCCLSELFSGALSKRSFPLAFSLADLVRRAHIFVGIALLKAARSLKCAAVPSFILGECRIMGLCTALCPEPFAECLSRVLCHTCCAGRLSSPWHCLAQICGASLSCRLCSCLPVYGEAWSSCCRQP